MVSFRLSRKPGPSLGINDREDDTIYQRPMGSGFLNTYNPKPNSNSNLKRIIMDVSERLTGFNIYIKVHEEMCERA